MELDVALADIREYRGRNVDHLTNHRFATRLVLLSTVQTRLTILQYTHSLPSARPRDPTAPQLSPHPTGKQTFQTSCRPLSAASLVALLHPSQSSEQDMSRIFSTVSNKGDPGHTLTSSLDPRSITIITIPVTTTFISTDLIHIPINRLGESPSTPLSHADMNRNASQVPF